MRLYLHTILESRGDRGIPRRFLTAIESVFEQLAGNDIEAFLHIKTNLQLKSTIKLVMENHFPEFSLEHVDNPSPFPFFRQAAEKSPFDCFGYIRENSPYLSHIAEMLESVRDSGRLHLAYLKDGIRKQVPVRDDPINETGHPFAALLKTSDIILLNHMTVRKLGELNALPEGRERTVRDLIHDRPYR